MRRQAILAYQLHDKVGSADFGFVPGRGVFSHPHGPGGGAASLQQTWEAIVAGVPVSEQAKQHAELAAALEAFGQAPRRSQAEAQR